MNEPWAIALTNALYPDKEYTRGWGPFKKYQRGWDQFEVACAERVFKRVFAEMRALGGDAHVDLIDRLFGITGLRHTLRECAERYGSSVTKVTATRERAYRTMRVKFGDVIEPALRLLRAHTTSADAFVDELMEQGTHAQLLQSEVERLKSVITAVQAATHNSLASDDTQDIRELGLTVRSENCLRAEDIHTIGELCAKTEHELMRTPNLGRKSVGEIKQALTRHGRQLRVAL